MNSACRKCYVRPTVVNAPLDGSLLDTRRPRVDNEIAGSLVELPSEEATVGAFLQVRLKHEAEERSEATGK